MEGWRKFGEIGGAGVTATQGRRTGTRGNGTGKIVVPPSTENAVMRWATTAPHSGVYRLGQRCRLEYQGFQPFVVAPVRAAGMQMNSADPPIRPVQSDVVQIPGQHAATGVRQSDLSHTGCVIAAAS